ncbi:MAG: 4-hydroxy-tetrahydrodipicolinate synthase [Nanoarchaeota archaeon]|nr:4-hydroxy-tetrahydrodipicolinate synthase [Nanoarchaeota archaeon]
MAKKSGNSKSAVSKRAMFCGLMTALITPFKKNGQVDYPALRRLVEDQIQNGTDVLVPIGTTGESLTLTDEEKIRVVKTVVEQAKKRIPVVAGSGTNDTAKSIMLSKEMKKAGADGLLLVCPYYNKPTQKGFYLHFAEIASSVNLPIILYNVPGRTGRKMDNDVTIKLAKEFPNIVAMKEATGDINNIKDLIARAPKNFNVISGDDSLTVEIIRNGGKGIISVVSNILPGEVKKMTELALQGNYEAAEKINEHLNKLYEVIFIETNPIPVKTALAMQGKIEEKFRLPMCEMEPENKEKLRRVLKEMKLI